MAHSNILARRLNREVINLGFSGNGQLDLEIADVIAAVRASQEKIAELQARREEAESAEAAAPEEGKVCPVCGKISASNFCPQCGAPLE